MIQPWITEKHKPNSRTQAWFLEWREEHQQKAWKKTCRTRIMNKTKSAEAKQEGDTHNRLVAVTWWDCWWLVNLVKAVSVVCKRERRVAGSRARSQRMRMSYSGKKAEYIWCCSFSSRRVGADIRFSLLPSLPPPKCFTWTYISKSFWTGFHPSLVRGQF